MKSKYQLIIGFEHGDVSLRTKEKYKFDNEAELRQLLAFIYEVRNFMPDEGYENTGYFSDAHNERVGEWVTKIAAKYDPSFADYLERDKCYRGADYYAAVNSIYLKIDGVKHHIVWSQALATNVIDLVGLGEVIKTTTGGISFYGNSFDCDQNEFPSYDSLQDIYGKTIGDVYAPMEVKVVDVKIDEMYKHSDYTSYHYLILAEIPDGKVTISLYGYDPNYEIKFNKQPFDGLNVFVV